MRVVLDTNVLISALLFKKRLGEIETLIKTGSVTPHFISSSFLEFQNVLAYKKLQPYLEKNNITPEEIIKNLTPHCQILDDPQTIPNIVTHPGDNFILAAAKTANAEMIVTGDKELLTLKKYNQIPILTAQNFLKLFS